MVFPQIGFSRLLNLECFMFFQELFEIQAYQLNSFQIIFGPLENIFSVFSWYFIKYTLYLLITISLDGSNVIYGPAPLFK